MFAQYCCRLVYEVVKAEGPAIELAEADRGPHAFGKCLFVQVGVEQGDSKIKVLREASDRVHRICRMTDAQLVLINSFAGLATGALRARPEEALAVSSDLQRRLLERGYDTHMLPFGWMKQFPELQIDAGVWQQRVEEVLPPRDWGRPWAHRLPADFEAG